MRFFDPHNIPQTGDDRPASSVFSYAWRMSGSHQLGVCFLAVIVAGLTLIPIELQRRIINQAIGDGDLQLLYTLGGIYLGTILVQQALKFTLRLYQSWISESAVVYTRRHILGLYDDRIESGEEAEQGTTVQIAGGEIDKLGGFVGEGLSQLTANAAMLLGVIAYMLVVQPRMAFVAFGFLIPQIILTPVIQIRLNRLMEKRVGYMRDLGDSISTDVGPEAATSETLLPKIYGNRLQFVALKVAMKALINLVNLLAPLSVLVFGGYLAIEGETSLGVIVAFISAFERLADPIRELMTFYRTAAQANVQHEMIANWMNR